MSEGEVSLDAAAAIVRGVDDADLLAGLAAERDLLLGEVFRRMPERLRADRAAGIDAVVEWRVTERPGGGEDRWQLALRDGRCVVVRDGGHAPAVVFTIAPLDLLRMASGSADPAGLFVAGRLRVEGDLVLAAVLPSLFAVPR